MCIYIRDHILASSMCISGNQWIASLPWQLVVWNVWVCPGPDRSVAGLVPCAHVVNGPAGAQENVYNFMKPSPSGPILLIIHVGVLPCFSSQAWVTLCSLSPIPILFESRSNQFLLVHPCQIQPHGSVPRRFNALPVSAREFQECVPHHQPWPWRRFWT